MRLTKVASGKSFLSVTCAEWAKIGKRAGWLDKRAAGGWQTLVLDRIEKLRRESSPPLPPGMAEAMKEEVERDPDPEVAVGVFIKMMNDFPEFFAEDIGVLEALNPGMVRRHNPKPASPLA